MIAFAYYLLKMFVCSGLLFAYYHLALRNKLFHQWNRFYLLVSIVISLAVPCLQFNIWPGAENASDITLLRVVYSADEYVAEVRAGRAELSLDQWITILYSLVSVFVFLIFILALIRIYSIIRSHSVMSIDDIKFLNTEEKSAPFSFLNYVFWNKQIDLNSTSGEHIFQHELVHVREKHSWDKLFLQVVLIVFWCNPFFWLIRTELRMIHEFIADKKSVGQSDAHAFATMILQTVYPQHYTQLTNQFFHQSIKRRLAMLTKNKNPKLSYLSRVLALPLMALLIMAFTIKQKNKTPGNDIAFNTGLVVSDTVAVKQPTAFRAYKDKSIQWIYNDSIGKIISWEAAQKLGFVVKEEEFQKNFAGNNKDFVENLIKRPDPRLLADTLIDDNPLIVVDGKEMGKFRSMKNEVILSAERVSSVNVLKGESAIAKYGEKGKDGVVEITTKKTANAETLTKVLIRGERTFSGEKPLIIIDGKESDKLDDLPANAIQSINVLKRESATNKYGEKAKDGAIEIITKPSVTGSIIKATTVDGIEITANEVNVEGVKIRPSEKKDARTDLNEVVVVGYGKSIEDPNKVFEKVEKESEFPGGVNAWRRYLERYLNAQVPANNKAPHGRYTVIVRFIVALDGSISEIKAMTNHGYGMEEEVIRVISVGPKWKPAQQNGKDVMAWRSQPVTFVVSAR